MPRPSLEKILKVAQDRALALDGRAVGVIAEVKRRSPSAGAIRADLDPVRHARAYQRGGAVAISVLTEQPHFGGSLADLAAVAREVGLPVLRKDFIVHDLQVVEARAAGAAAVLLIARLLAPGALRRPARAARAQGLGTLIEAHTEDELDRALAAEPTAVGVNSRDLATFAVHLEAAERLVGKVPPDIPAVAESGIAARPDVERMAAAGADLVLVGTSVARTADPTLQGGKTHRGEDHSNVTIPNLVERAVDGRFGPYGGRYVPETLMAALEELERVYEAAKGDAEFWGELDGLLKDYVGRPTPLTETPRLGEQLGDGVIVALKREDLNHTGAHKINNTLGQALLARRMGKRRIIAETGAGQHGVATATVCARFGLDCVVYMGEE